MTTIQIRVDEKTKRDSARVLKELGLDLSSAIKVYLKQIVHTKGIPFPVVTENGFTPKREREILHASREARRGAGLSRKLRGKIAVKAYLDTLK